MMGRENIVVGTCSSHEVTGASGGMRMNALMRLFTRSSETRT